MKDMLHIACRAAYAGGAILRHYFSRELAIQEKAGTDFLTEADLAAEETILAILPRADAKIGVISEEYGSSHTDAAYTWVIDPLDGTHNFVTGIPHFAISIALRHKDTVELGVVYQPIADILWHAQRGEGAYRNEFALVGQPPARPYTTVAYIQGHAAPKAATSVLPAIQKSFGRVFTNWTPALDWCLLADGRLDALISMDSEQEDQLAGMFIAQEAGRNVTDFQGEAYIPGMSRLIASQDPKIHARLQQLLAAVQDY